MTSGHEVSSLLPRTCVRRTVRRVINKSRQVSKRTYVDIGRDRCMHGKGLA